MAPRSSESFYDTGEVYACYAAHRAIEGFRSPNVVMEEPAVLAELADPTGLRVVDLGCGDARFGRHLLAAGVRSYLGIDNSEQMIAQATQHLRGPGGRVALNPLEDVRLATESADLVTARLSLHYLADLAGVLTTAAGALVAGGRLLITVPHPVFTSHDNRPAGPRTSWEVDDYFDAGPRVRAWMGGHVTWYHRTVEQYVRAMLDAGLEITALRECEPDPTRFDGHLQEYRRRRRMPLFLLIVGRKREQPNSSHTDSATAREPA